MGKTLFYGRLEMGSFKISAIGLDRGADMVGEGVLIMAETPISLPFLSLRERTCGSEDLVVMYFATAFETS